MEPRRLPTPTLKAVSDWGLGTGDWGLGWSTVESVGSATEPLVVSVVAAARSVQAAATPTSATPANQRARRLPRLCERPLTRLW